MIGLHRAFVRGPLGAKYYCLSAAYTCRFYSNRPPSKDDCVNKQLKCLGDSPPLETKCAKAPEEICQQGALKVPTLPTECKSDVKSAPVYDKTCSRPYNNPCLPDISKTCKCDMVPQPCLSPCERKKRQICLGEPDCAYERKIDWGLRIRQLLLGIGAIVGGLILYRIYGDEKITEKLQLKRDKRFVRPMEIVKIPEASSEIPDKIDYLMIGGGAATYAAQRAIRASNKEAKILIVCDSPPFKPSMRPPLSDWLWKEPDRDKALDLEFRGWDGKNHSIHFEPDQYYTPVQKLGDVSTKGGVGVAQGWSVKKLIPQKRVAVLDDGKKITYGKCLLATGGHPKVIHPFSEAEQNILGKVTFYRNSFDFLELEELIQDGIQCIAVVGGGLLGTELSAALKERTKQDGTRIVNIVKDPGNLKKILPSYLSKRISTILMDRGIHVLTDTTVEDISRDGNQIKLYVTNDKCVTADHVIVATGILPNIDLSKGSCLEVDPVNGGFLVNSEMHSMSGIYAAGDCASFYDCTLGRRREEHHNFAIATGQIAGENMAGKNNTMNLQPTFWCHLGPDYEIEATGLADTLYPTVGVFPKKTHREELNEEDEGDDEDDGVAQLRHVSHQKAGSGKNKKNTSDEKRGTEEKYDKKDNEKFGGDHLINENAKDGHFSLSTDNQKASGDGKFDRVEGDTDIDTQMSHQKFEKGVVYYLNDNQEIIGILTINLPGKIAVAQQLIKEKKTYEDINEVTLKFDLHSDEQHKKKRTSMLLKHHKKRKLKNQNNL